MLATVLSSAMLLTGCGATTNGTAKGEQAQNVTTEPRKIIIDTDTGADDAAALVLAAKDKNIQIMGVTTLVGNVDVEQNTKNALMALESAGYDAPVYCGSEDTYNGKTVEAFSVFGEDGMGDADLIHPKGTAQEQDAISFMIDTIQQNPGEIEIIALGPATNIAKAIKKAPEVMKKVKKIWSMGTAGLGPGNASPVAEFNVYHDAEAYQVMLDFGIPVAVIGLDVCDGEALWTSAQFDELNKANDTGKLVASSFQKLRDFYAQNGSDDGTMVCDPVAVMCAINPEFVKESIQTHGSCITDEGETYAQVIFYKEGFTYDAVPNDYDHNVTLITQVDKENYFNLYLDYISDKT